jgi:hypothetical protein
MDSIAPPKAAPDFKPPQPPEKAANENAPAELNELAEKNAPQPRDLTPAKLEVSLDPSAQRFVQTLTDPATSETVLRYPSETQLAYSRAVLAYLRAQNS